MRLDFDPEQCRNESEVESKLLVHYLLPALGYSVDDWHQEVAVGSIRLDFLAFAAQVLPFTLDAASSLSVVLEAKSPSQNLKKHIRRLRYYLVSLRVRYGLLTNGKKLQIFERSNDDIHLKFECEGREIAVRINEIKAIIGRSSLKRPEAGEAVETHTLVSHLNKASKSSSSENRRNSVKTIAIYHNKGGVGKTTVSINLAAALRIKGKRVLLIDLDSQANTTFAAGLIKFQFEEDDNLKDQNVYHLLESGERSFIPELVKSSHFFNSPEIDVIPSHINLIEGQYRLNQIGASRTRLISKLKKVENSYDVVIIDTPPSRDLYAEVAMMAADYLIIPSDLKPFANQGLSSVKSFVEQVNESRDMIGKQPITIMGVLPSKISSNSKYFTYTFPKQKAVIHNHYNLPVMDTIIFDRTDLSHCLNKTLSVGELDYPDPKSIFEYAQSHPPANAAAEEFENLAEEVLKKME